MTERELQDAVLECARLLGWRCAHFRPAKTAKGWRTPVEADGAGFPDITMVRRGRLIFAELKTARGKTSPAQDTWIAALSTACGEEGLIPEVYVWRPVDWTSGRIEELLR